MKLNSKDLELLSNTINEIYARYKASKKEVIGYIVKMEYPNGPKLTYFINTEKGIKMFECAKYPFFFQPVYSEEEAVSFIDYLNKSRK